MIHGQQIKPKPNIRSKCIIDIVETKTNEMEKIKKKNERQMDGNEGCEENNKFQNIRKKGRICKIKNITKNLWEKITKGEKMKLKTQNRLKIMGVRRGGGRRLTPPNAENP